MIPSTHISLLLALKDTGQFEDSWKKFQNRYEDIILGWALRRGLQPADAEDVAQLVLVKLFQALPSHEHDPSRRFRTWLNAVVKNAVRDFGRARQRRPAEQGRGGSDILDQFARLEDAESLDDLANAVGSFADPQLNEAVKRVKERVGERTWQIFWRVTIEGQATADVAADLGMSYAAVCKARSRVADYLAEEYHPG